jgi:hypothetical protein
MSETTKPPTAQGISRLLAKAGFERSVSHATRIKGWRDWNEGYVVKTCDTSTVRVEHRLEKWARGEAADKRAEDFLTAYIKTLTEAGFAVARDEGWSRRLIVTARES